MKSLIKGYLPIICLVSIFLMSLASAIPGIPHQLYGTVKVSNVSVPDGTGVIAKIGGIATQYLQKMGNLDMLLTLFLLKTLKEIGLVRQLKF